ncbi:unnamed protein product [Dracunculus medinensis]|uniref:Rho-GAP domain-containing protein n=1 Tax=Dracunculus medinensis TaxID=318479 RepID=A0A0N4U4I3_DRAME|nr:unnamed protein product [Dracunculus medinensis]
MRINEGPINEEVDNAVVAIHQPRLFSRSLVEEILLHFIKIDLGSKSAGVTTLSEVSWISPGILLYHPSVFIGLEV